MKNDPKARHRGIGNAATGMSFKSVFLGQGRTDSKSHVALGNFNHSQLTFV